MGDRGPGGAAPVWGPTRPGTPATTPPSTIRWKRIVSDEHAARRATAAGAPDDVAHALEPFVRSFGQRAEADLIVRLHYPGMAFDDAARAVSLFGEQVLPSLRRSPAASPAAETRPPARPSRAAREATTTPSRCRPRTASAARGSGLPTARVRPPSVRGERSVSSARTAPRAWRVDPSNRGCGRVDRRPIRPAARKAQGRERTHIARRAQRPAHLATEVHQRLRPRRGARRSSQRGRGELGDRDLVGLGGERGAGGDPPHVRVEDGTARP